jgi:cytidine deaminase
MENILGKEFDISEIETYSKSFNEILTIEELNQLIDLSIQAKERSYSPYSKFRVGCALITPEGKFIQGTNVENLSYGLTVCAERNAICHAVVSGEKKFKAAMITTDMEYFVTPCGMCRQILQEFNVDYVVLLTINKRLVIYSMSYLLPAELEISHLGK